VVEVGGLGLPVVGGDEAMEGDGDVGCFGRVADLRLPVAVGVSYQGVSPKSPATW